MVTELVTLQDPTRGFTDVSRCGDTDSGRAGADAGAGIRVGTIIVARNNRMETEL
jgi:hypothetical protein